MPEPERLLARHDGPVGAHQVLAHQALQPGRDVVFVHRHDLHSALVERLALDRSALQHGALGGRELIQPRSQQRGNGRRDSYGAAA